MPPKRSHSSAAAAPTAANKKSKTTANKSKVTKKSTRTREIREDSPPEKDFDSYDDAVRDAILNTTKSRYDVSLEQDRLAFAANLMESSSSSLSSLSQEQSEAHIEGEQHSAVVKTDDGGGGSQARTLTEMKAKNGARRRVFSLGTLSLHAVVKHFDRLAVGFVKTNTITSSAATRTGAEARVIGGGGGGGGGVSDDYFQRQFFRLPFYLSERLFTMLKQTRPELLSVKIWTGLFFNPGTISGDRIMELDLEGIIPSQVTDTAIRNNLLRQLGIGPSLTLINLSHQTEISDKCVADLVAASTSLAKLSVKGCAKVGDLTLARLPESTIEELNISFLGVGCTAKGLMEVLYRCRRLRVLKCAGVVSVKDAMLVQLEKRLRVEQEQEQGQEQEQEQKKGGGVGSREQRKDHGVSSEVDSGSGPLAKLENLKISTTSLGDRGLKVLLSLCGRSLRRLDISQTNVTRPAMIGEYCVWENAGGRGSEGESAELNLANTMATTMTRLEKLNLTRLTMSTANELWTLLQMLPPNSLHTLLMGYITHSRSVLNDNVFDVMSSSHLEEVEGEDAVVTNVSDSLPPVLRASPRFFLRTLSLFGNNELGPSGRDRGSLRWLLSTLAPYLKRLELGYTRYDHQVLLGLLDPPRSRRPNFETLVRDDIEAEIEYNVVLEELGMDATRIGDEGTLVLARLAGLRRLSLANTQISKDAVEVIISGCEKLNSLDLTSCRGVPVVERRTLLKDIRRRMGRE